MPRMFKPKSIDVVASYIDEHAFATLVSHKYSLVASHIPLLLMNDGDRQYLSGHLSLANGQVDCFDDQQELMAIFMHSHSYISSSWYDHVNVPTWNYIAVHIYGRARKIQGQELYKSMEQMVHKYESGREGRFNLEDFSKKELHAHLRGLVGFEMTIDRIEAAYKLSQNRKDHDYNNIIEQLESSESQLDHAIAQEMRKLR